MESIGALIKRLREERSLSQSRLARISGVDRGYINKLEAGREGTISLRVARALAQALGVPATVFLEGNVGPLPLRVQVPAKDLVEELKVRLELLEVIEVPLWVNAHELV